MKNVLKALSIIAPFCVPGATLLGCATDSPRVSEPVPELPAAIKDTRLLYLTDSMLSNSRGDFRRLFSDWLEPRLTEKVDTYWRMPVASAQDTRALEDNILEGVARFCRKNGWVFGTTGDSSDRGATCRTTNDIFVGGIYAQALSDGTRYWMNLRISTHQPTHSKRDYEELVKTNGPIGIVHTPEGSASVLRFGTLSQRSVLCAMIANTDCVPLEAIQELDVALNRVTFIDPNRAPSRFHGLFEQTTRKSPEWLKGLRLVLEDQDSAEPYTVLINMDEIQKIEIKGTAEQWKLMESGRLDTDYVYATPERIIAFTRSLRRDLQALRQMAEADGWSNLVPQDGRIPEGVQLHLKQTLARTLRDKHCRNGGESIISLGIEEPSKLLLCHQARKELRLIDSGYVINEDLTPMSMVIVFQRYRDDLST